jgi:membrane-associated phospholipid phosphatase
LSPERGRSVRVIAAALVVAAAVTADVIMQGRLTRLDHRIADWAWAANIRHGNLLRAALIYGGTMAGDPRGIGLLVVPFLAVLAWRRRSWQPVLRFAVACGLLLAVVWACKAGMGRTPPGTAGLVRTGGRSYPSGHTITAVVMSGLVARLAVDFGLPALWRAPLRVLAWVAPVATGAGMVLLVYHWLTDAVAGLAVGVVVLRVIALIFAGRLGDWGNASWLGRAGPDSRHAAAHTVDAGVG